MDAERGIIEIASERARQENYNTDEYDISVTHESHEWAVRFQGKQPAPGNFFTILIDDKTKTVKDIFHGK